MAERILIEVEKERMEQHLKTRQHVDSKYLKAFIEERILESIADVETAENMCKQLDEYKKEHFQDESVVFRILQLKATKKLKEIKMEEIDEEIDSEIEKLEELYAEDENTKISNIVEKIKVKK